MQTRFTSPAVASLLALALAMSVPGICRALEFTSSHVFSENRQYAARFWPFGNDSYWQATPGVPSQVRYFMTVAGDTNRTAGTPIPAAELTTVSGSSPLFSEPQNIGYTGNQAGMLSGVAASYFYNRPSPYNNHQAPDAWENKIFRLTLYTDTTKNTVADTADVNTTGRDYQALAIPTATVAPGPGGDIFHPTVSWDAVSGATDYRVLVLTINCRDAMPINNNPLHLSAPITGATQYTFPADDATFVTGVPLAIWVQARQIADGQLINRSSYFSIYSPFLDSLGGQDLTAGSGWSAFKDPADNSISFTPTADSLALSGATTGPGQEHFGKWQKSVDGLRGLIADYTVSQIQGDAFVGIRKNVAQLANGNYLRAELRLQHYFGEHFVRYRVREYQQDSWNEIRIVAEGNVGAGWSLDQPYTLGLILADDQIFFLALGVNKFCPFIAIPIEDDYTPMSSNAELHVDVYQASGDDRTSSVSATAGNVRLVMADDLPTDVECDVDNDGRTGLAEAIHALQVTSGLRP